MHLCVVCMDLGKPAKGQLKEYPLNTEKPDHALQTTYNVHVSSSN